MKVTVNVNIYTHTHTYIFESKLEKRKIIVIFMTTSQQLCMCVYDPFQTANLYAKPRKNGSMSQFMTMCEIANLSSNTYTHNGIYALAHSAWKLCKCTGKKTPSHVTPNNDTLAYNNNKFSKYSVCPFLFVSSKKRRRWWEKKNDEWAVSKIKSSTIFVRFGMEPKTTFFRLVSSEIEWTSAVLAYARLTFP